MTKCVVCGATYSQKNPNISFHRIPKLQINEWESATGMQLSETDRVCSIHFDEEHIHVVGNKRCLKHNALPTLLLASQDEQSMFIETVKHVDTIDLNTNAYDTFSRDDTTSVAMTKDDTLETLPEDSISFPQQNLLSVRRVIRYPDYIEKNSLCNSKVEEKNIGVLQKSLAINKKKFKFYQQKCRRLERR